MQFGFGLHLHSDIPVPGAVVPDCPIIAPTKRIVRDSFAPGTNDPGFSKIGSAIFYQHSDASFLCDAQQISVRTRDDSHIDDVGAQLIANALPALLWLAGSFMLHAACVRLPTSGVVAIAGHSGSGKSRLASACVANGAELIGDDSLALSMVGERALAAGLPGGWYARNGDDGARHFCPAPAGAAMGMAQIDLIVFIDDRPQSDGFVPRLTALELLLQHRHRPQVPKLLGKQLQVLAMAADFAQHVPSFTIHPASIAALTIEDLAQMCETAIAPIGAT
jgi:hypothetical protein